MSREEEARDKGWVSQEEWVESGHEAGQWVDAPEFLFRGELMDRIKSQTGQIRGLVDRDNENSKKIDELSKALKAMGEHNRKMEEVTYKKALRELRKAQSEATSEGDHELAAEIEERIDDLRSETEETSEEVSEPAQNTPTPAYNSPEDAKVFTAWVEENSWFQNDFALRGAAMAVSQTIDHTGLSSSEYLAEIKKKMVEQFPEKLGKRTRTVAVTEPSADGTENSYKPKSKYTQSDLSDDQRRVMRTLIESGAPLSAQEYVDQLAELGEIGA